MRHLLKHMFAVQVVILMIFCAHTCTAAVVPVNGNFTVNADATVTATAAELTRAMHESDDENEAMATPNALQPKLDSTHAAAAAASTEKSLRILPVVSQRVEKSLVASDGTAVSTEQT